jgi:protein gp37
MRFFMRRLRFADKHLVLSEGALATEEQALLPNLWLVAKAASTEAESQLRLTALLNVKAAVRGYIATDKSYPLNLAPFIDELDWVVEWPRPSVDMHPCHEAHARWLREIGDLCLAAGKPFTPCGAWEVARRSPASVQVPRVPLAPLPDLLHRSTALAWFRSVSPE